LSRVSTIGYIPGCTQHRIELRLPKHDLSPHDYEVAVRALGLIWGDLSGLGAGKLKSDSLFTDFFSLFHNAVAQDAYLPLFGHWIGSPFKRNETHLYGWMPTFLKLPKGLHEKISRGCLEFLTHLQNKDELSAIYKKTTGEVRQVSNHLGFAAFDSTLPILQLAYELGLNFTLLGSGAYQIGQGNKSKIIMGACSTSDSAIGAMLSDNKFTTSQILSSCGLPVPDSRLATRVDHMHGFCRQVKAPWVVKPADANRGEGVSSGIYSESALNAAFLKAKKASRTGSVIIQETLAGDCHRINVCGQEIISVVKRRPKGVVGDGRRTVEQLISLANKRQQTRPERIRLKPFPDDDISHEALAAQNLTSKSIPKRGQYVPLRLVTTVADGGQAETVTHLLHPDNAAIAIEATRSLGLDTAGVDFFSTDIALPWYESGGKILEVNFRPQLVNRPSDRVTGQQSFHLARSLFKDCKQIPIHVFIGDAEAAANAKRAAYRFRSQGGKYWYVGEDGIVDNTGSTRPLQNGNLWNAISALILNPCVSGLCIQIGTWGQSLALPISHCNSINPEAVLKLGPPEKGWLEVINRLSQVMRDAL